MSRLTSNISLLMVIGLIFCGLATEAYSQTELAGTYQLDAARSENVNDIVESATRNNRTSRANKEDLEDKLEAPQIVAIDIRGNQVTLSTSQASNPITFTADGRTKTSTRSDGSAIRVRVTLEARTLTISSFGGDTDYTLTFTSIDNGRSMRVTRRITTDYLRQTIFADSYYDRTGSYARVRSNSGGYSDDGQYSTTDPDDYPTNTRTTPTTRTVGTGDFKVPQGTVLTAILENKVSTKVSQENDRFSMTVQSPREFEGAIVEGYLSEVKRSGRITGRSSFTMNFETIRMPNGRTYDFAGVLQSATDRTGKVIAVGDEGDARGGSQTKESIKRGGIGAGVGAILGAIIGGGKGALIGATIGGGAGTGSVIAQGRGDIELEEGSTITVESTSPNN